jgi:hypothetical protein
MPSSYLKLPRETMDTIFLFLTVLMWILSRKQHTSRNGLVTEVHGAKIQQKAETGLCWKW